MELDDLARRYHTDPYTVLGWAPERIALASMAKRAGIEEATRRIREGKATVTYTIEV